MTTAPRLDDPLHDREIGSRDSTLDTTRIDDVRIGAVRPLITPALLQERVPVRDDTLALVEGSRAAIADVLHGRDDRLVVVVGPCSIHDHDQAIEYAQRLKAVGRPSCRTTCCRHARLLREAAHDRRLEGLHQRPAPRRQLRASTKACERARAAAARADHARPADRHRVPRPAEPAVHRRPVAWGAIGARTTESQSHRQLASGLSCPVGFKNGTDGSVQVAADAILAARAPHAFMGMTKMGVAAIFETRGNDDCHVILRGGKAPNYDAAERGGELRGAARGRACREQVMIDVSHGNSGKRHRAADRDRRRRRGADRRRRAAHHRR